MAKRNIPIRYTNRDFDSIRNELVNYAKRYYPDTFRDFSEASFGSLMSFYLDYQVNESFMDTAVEYDNVLRLAKQMGYKYKGAPSTTGMVTLYVIVPANTTGLGPDTRYLPILKRNTVLGSTGGSFILTEDVRFDNPNNQMVAAQVSTSGVPTSYVVKAEGQIISGQFGVETVTTPTHETTLLRWLGHSSRLEDLQQRKIETLHHYSSDTVLTRRLRLLH